MTTESLSCSRTSSTFQASGELRCGQAAWWCTPPSGKGGGSGECTISKCQAPGFGLPRGSGSAADPATCARPQVSLPGRLAW